MCELIDDYLQFLGTTQGRADATLVKYGGYLRRMAAWAESEDTALTALDAHQVERFTGLVMHKEGLSPRSRRALVASVRGFYRWARRRGLVEVDPADQLPYPKTGRRLPVPMGLRNAEKMLMQPDISTLTGARDAAMLSVLIGCGVRISGLAAMNQSGLLWMDYEGSEWLVIKVREKGGNERFIPAPHETRLLIRAYLGHAELEDIDRTLPSGDQVLWVSTRNRKVPEHKYHGEARRMAVRSIADRLVAIAAEAGVPRAEAHPHAMRHLYGTELAEDDVDILVRKALMGHANVASTEVYSHLASRKLMGAVSKANPLGKLKTPVTELLKHLQQTRP